MKRKDILFFAGAIIAMTGLVGIIVTNFIYWDIAMSLKMKIIYFWKPCLVAWLGIITMKLTK